MSAIVQSPSDLMKLAKEFVDANLPTLAQEVSQKKISGLWLVDSPMFELFKILKPVSAEHSQSLGESLVRSAVLQKYLLLSKSK